MIAALLLPLMAPAAELLQPPRRWFDTPGTAKEIIVDSGGKLGVAGDGGVADAVLAVEVWNSAGLVLHAVPGDTSGMILGDTTSHMSFSDPFNVCKGLCLAATYTGFYNANVTGTCDGLTVVEIEDSDIVFNNSGPFGSAWTSESEEASGAACSGEVFLETVVTHEVGHLIGLGHENDVVAVMNSSIASCDNQLLQPDDLAGRNTLYDCTLSTCQSTCDGSALECGEVCDGSNLGGATCLSQGFDAGTLGCNGSCTAFDTSSCSTTITNETGLCTDGIDNDNDGPIDCADSDCTSDPACDTGGECSDLGEVCIDRTDCCASLKCKGTRGGGAKTCQQ